MMEERKENNAGDGNIFVPKGNLWFGDILRCRVRSPQGSWEVRDIEY